MTPHTSAAPEIHAFLRQRVRDVYGGVLSRFAEACGVAPTMASKWVAEEPERQRVPSPDSCRRIADALGVDEDYVLVLAGHRRGAAAAQRHPRVAALAALIERAFQTLSPQEWELREAAARAVFSVPEMRVNDQWRTPVNGMHGPPADLADPAEATSGNPEDGPLSACKDDAQRDVQRSLTLPTLAPQFAAA
jgi:transcriptional regulator with XRE-family HTH domain